MTPAIIIPRVRTSSNEIQSPISRCGDNWWRDIRIRDPYKDYDNAFRTLPALGDPDQVESLDPSFPEEIRVDADRVAKFVSEHAGELSDFQRMNIDTLMRRVIVYISDAVKIQKLWSSGFETNSQRIQPLPLHIRPINTISANIKEGHRRDSNKWKRLILSAVRNLRCAEEVAKKATIRQYNKDLGIRGRRYAANIPSLDTGTKESTKFTPVSPAIPAAKLTPVTPLVPGLSESPYLGAEPSPGDPPLPEMDFEQDAELEGGSTSTESISTPKKKDNSILIAAAAALGILALSKGKR